MPDYDETTPHAYALPVVRQPSGVWLLDEAWPDLFIELNSWGWAQALRAPLLPGQLNGSTSLPIASGALTFSGPSTPDDTIGGAGGSGSGSGFGFGGGAYGSGPYGGGGFGGPPPKVVPWFQPTLPPVFDGREFLIWTSGTPLLPSTVLDVTTMGQRRGVFRADPISGALSSGDVKVEFTQLWADARPVSQWWHHFTSTNTLNPQFWAPTTNPEDEPTTVGLNLWHNCQQRSGVNWPYWAPLDGDTYAAMVARFPELVTANHLADGVTLPALFAEIAGGVGGAAWPRVDTGRWVFRSAAELANSSPVATVKVLDELEDLPWSSDRSEVFDGVVVKYRSVDWQVPTSWTDQVDWESDAVLPLPTKDYPIEGDHPLHGAYAQCNVNTLRHGDGTNGGNLVEATTTAQHLASNRWNADYFDSDDTMKWIVNPDGTPSAQLRAKFRGRWIDQSLGVGDQTGRVFEYAAGQSCQTPQAAQALATRLYGIVRARRWRCGKVRIQPEFGLCEIGDTIRVTHPEGLDVRGVVVGDEWRAEPGKLAHYIEFAVCVPTVGDSNAAWDAHQSGATLGDYNTFWDAVDPSATLGDYVDHPLA